MKQWFALIVLCSLTIILTGCAKKGLPGLVPGKGVVLYDGKPLADAFVMLSPANDVSGLRGATGTTNEAGEFTLMTLDSNDGVQPGEYIVTIEKTKRAPKFDEEAGRKFMRGEGPPPPPPSGKLEHEISSKYYSKETTDLRITIGPKGDKKIKFELTSN